MAFWKRYPHGIVVFRARGTKLSRKLTKHLDNQPDHNIEAWVAHWALANEGRRANVEALTDPDWLRRLDQYCVYLVGHKGRSPSTVRWHRQVLRDWVLPYFLAVDPVCASVSEWHLKSARLLAYLQGKGIAQTGLRRATIATRLFWTWLSEEGHLPEPGMTIVLRNPRMTAAHTPLALTVSPDDIIRFVMATQDPHIRIMTLTGYFFSLRTNEVFALRPRDFVGGTKATALDDASAMRQMKLYDRLAVHVQRQRTQTGAITAPKVHSFGLVSCFEERAAKLLVAAINGLDPEALLLPWRPDRLMKHWRKHGYGAKPGDKGTPATLTLKDLRRASLYWLGHNTPFAGAAIMLQKHARHQSLTTTQMYLRRPKEDEQEWSPLDLDA